MRILCDTNLLVRAAKPDDERHALATAAILELHRQNHELVIVPQCCYEYYVVATRPEEHNGLGLTVEGALVDIEGFLDLFRLMRDERSIFDTWKAIIQQHRIQGRNAHDARLVAAMRRHGVGHVLTFNPGDFHRFNEIDVLTPESVVRPDPPNE